MAGEIRAVVVTVSDRCAAGEREDVSGGRLAELLAEAGATVLERALVPDDAETLAALLREYAGRLDVNLIVTTGGTGLSARDNTPEATRAVIQREVPGLAEAMRAATIARTPTAMLSRGVSGIRTGTLIVNLPGSPRGVEECFAVIAPVLSHAIEILTGRSH